MEGGGESEVMTPLRVPLLLSSHRDRAVVVAGRIGNSFLTCSFTVIEHAEIDLLVGLDVLRAHRCDISLSKNRMRFHAGGKAKEVRDAVAGSTVIGVG